MAKVDPTSFLKNSERILKKEISLKEVVDQYLLLEKRKATFSEVVKISGYSKKNMDENAKFFA